MQNKKDKDYMRTYATVILCITVAFLFADQNLLAPNLSAIAHEFHFSDAERDDLLGGRIAFGFFIVGGFISLLAGYMADTMNRCKLFAVMVCFGEAACLATYLVTSYSGLYFCRVLTGVSIGAAAPIICSLMGDLYPTQARGYVLGLVGICINLGKAFGQMLAGFIGPTYGWRLPFVVIAVPAIMLAIVVYFTISEPSRGNQEEAVLHARLSPTIEDKKHFSDEEKGACVELVGHDGHSQLTHRSEAPRESFKKKSHLSSRNDGKEYSLLPRDNHLDDAGIEKDEYSNTTVTYTETFEFSKVKTLLQTPSVVLLLMQGPPGCLPWGMIGTFLNDFFSNDRGLSVELASTVLGVFGAGMFAGQIVGGIVGQITYNYKKSMLPLIMGSSTIFGVLPMLYMLNASDLNSMTFFVVTFLAGVFAVITGSNIRFVLQNVTSPETRGTAFSLFNLTDDVGAGSGPGMLAGHMLSWSYHDYIIDNIII
jgi:predicted MFS family arabinose efflux permease